MRNRGMHPSLKLCLTGALLCAATAHAELGGKVNAAPAAQTGLKAVVRAQAVNSGSASYTLNETTAENGVTVREYAGADGTVFAVSWQGPVKPDLQALLGRYFSRFTASGPRPSGTGPLLLRDTDVVIYSGGHPRAFEGRAWVPALIPQGVSVDALE